MKNLINLYKRTEKFFTQWMAVNSILFLRVSLGIIYFWFGFLKYFPHQSPAEDLAADTIEKLTFGTLSLKTSIIILASWESLIGIGLIVGKFMRITLLLLFSQMIGTLLPLFLFPEQTFSNIPLVPTLEGQYIIKNLVIIGAAFILTSTVRGGGIIADPEIAEKAKKKEEKKLEMLKR